MQEFRRRAVRAIDENPRWLDLFFGEETREAGVSDGESQTLIESLWAGTQAQSASARFSVFSGPPGAEASGSIRPGSTHGTIVSEETTASILTDSEVSVFSERHASGHLEMQQLGKRKMVVTDVEGSSGALGTPTSSKSPIHTKKSSRLPGSARGGGFSNFLPGGRGAVESMGFGVATF